MANKLTPHAMLLAALICLLVFGMATGRAEIGTAIGAAIALTLHPTAIVAAIVIGLWFVQYRQLLLALIAAVIILQLLASFALAPSPAAVAQLQLSAQEAAVLRALGLIYLAHLFNAARLFFSRNT